MVAKITGKNITITEAMKNSINDKLSFLDKFLKESDRVTVTVSNRKTKIKMIAIVSYNGKIIKIEREVDNFYDGLDIIVEKLKNTILRQHEFKVKQRNSREKMFENVSEESETAEIEKEKIVELMPITKHEALELMETYGYDFFMFLNCEKNNSPSTVYRRHDGTYGVLNSK